MDWRAIQSTAFLILSGSMAVMTFILYGIVRDLLMIRTDMLTLVENLRSSGNLSSTGRDRDCFGGIDSAQESESAHSGR
jgi:hypothetical protein